MKPSDWPLSKNEEKTKPRVKSVGEYLFNLHTHRYDGGVLGGLLDGHGHLHSHL